MDKIEPKMQWLDLFMALNRLYDGKVYTDEDSAFEYNVVKDIGDDARMVLYYDDENELWKISLLKSNEETMLYATNNYSLHDIMVAFMNRVTLEELT